MDWWKVALVLATLASSIAVAINWSYRSTQKGMQEEIERIIKRLDSCPGFCSEHDKNTTSIIKLIDMDEKLDRIYRMMLYLIKKNYFHRHTEDGKTLIMADGLEEFIKDVAANNK